MGKLYNFVISKEKERMNESKDDDSSTQNTNVQDSRGSISSLGTSYSAKIPHGRISSENFPKISDVDKYFVGEYYSFQSPVDVKVSKLTLTLTLTNLT